MTDATSKPQDTGLHAPTDMLTRGFDPALSVGSARPAVFRSSTYVFPSPEAAERAFDLSAGRARPAPGESVALIYSRFNHPNAEILEEQIVPLEPGASCALVFNSGMSAIMNALLAFLKPGATLVYSVPIYGGTQKLIQAFLEPWGVRGVPVHAGRGGELDAALRDNPQVGVVLIETPANPTLTMTDIARACRSAAGVSPRPLVMVDNTMLGPTFQHPLELGADLVLYSATKYLSGFSDLIGGVALARDPELLRKLKLLRNLFGTILQPDECWMLNSRLPTVELRMRQAAANARRIAKRLARHAKIARVLYPALFTDPAQIAIREAQCEASGAMLSIELAGGKPAAFEFLRRLRIARNAVSLGGVETLVCHPKTTTHSGFSEKEFAAAGVTDGLVRISIGVEDWRDLLADFEQALGSG
ncbi:MAG: cystathionine gamma-synthase [Betaproteobacteria bacterium RIFCSPLOWO2_02_67_12]|nr:MAG: cystathionine gamma-synthase [Betaproteobacteria bacterium RIFCSPLOWO2_02_67_12]OGA31315.1 MAG: cystathionine gamma-synthase [Betaproteobacteria bacterium RIFCSPLOWO2_02_FULL_68_150]OGA70144.1 MAG: cystathionine gamma-synthase [Betaproteobacteria bacterium RIFCSPLOWO2_12_FULL_67_28]